MNGLKNKVVLVTGGTGSFGREFLDSINLSECKEVRIFSRDELKQELMRTEINNDKVRFYIGDVRDRDGLNSAMKGVDLVFHAAALKQVPSCEFFPEQAVMTNVLGSKNVIDAALGNSVSHVVCLSTDKAVYPLNAMGLSKALMEKVARAAARSAAGGPTTVSCVRYGNVMYSRGSVIPLFVHQIKSKEPLTVTHPEMTRFLLALKDAISLVFMAFENGSQGDIFVKKAPACTVIDLATALKNLFGAKNEIRTMGIRHAEKMHETLATVEELNNCEEIGDYFRCFMDTRTLNYKKYSAEGYVPRRFAADYTSENTTRLTVPEIEKLLLTLPELKRELA